MKEKGSNSNKIGTSLTRVSEMCVRANKGTKLFFKWQPKYSDYNRNEPSWRVGLLNYWIQITTWPKLPTSRRFSYPRSLPGELKIKKFLHQASNASYTSWIMHHVHLGTERQTEIWWNHPKRTTKTTSSAEEPTPCFLDTWELSVVVRVVSFAPSFRFFPDGDEWRMQTSSEHIPFALRGLSQA